MIDLKTYSNISFGGASLSSDGGGYGFGHVDSKVQDEILNFSFHHGVRVYDTAPIYGFGKSEEKLGEYFKTKREEICIVSKSGVDWHDSGRVNMTNDPKVTLKMLEASLKRLQSDYIDVYMIHWPDPKIDIRYPLEVLFKAKMEGKILSIGLCNSNAEDLKKAKSLGSIDALQGENNLFKPFDSFIEDQVFTMGWGSFDKGILAGAVNKNRSFSKNDCRSWAPWWKKSNWKEKVVFVEMLMNKYDISKTQLKSLALRFCYANVQSPIIGFTKLEQIEEAMNLSKEYTDLDQEIINEFSLF